MVRGEGDPVQFQNDQSDMRVGTCQIARCFGVRRLIQDLCIV